MRDEATVAGPFNLPRSWLFVPGAAQRFVEKLATIRPEARPDAVIFDLEDGVATGDLIDARRRVAALSENSDTASWFPKTVAVRTHALSHPEFAKDIEALGPRITALMLPKVDSAPQIAEAVTRLADMRLEHVGIVAVIESAAGLEAASEIARSLAASGPSDGTVPQGMAFGAEDFAADLGLFPHIADTTGKDENLRSDSGRLSVLDSARARIVISAASVGISLRIDTPVLQYREAFTVEQEARRSRTMGFSSKFCIHPVQVEPVHRGFEPSSREVAWAHAILGHRVVNGVWQDDDQASQKSAMNRSAGATAREGQMVDEAIARQARSILSTKQRRRHT